MQKQRSNNNKTKQPINRINAIRGPTSNNINAKRPNYNKNTNTSNQQNTCKQI